MSDLLSPDKLAPVREFNDRLRQTFAGGRVVLSAGVAVLGQEMKAAALRRHA